MSRIVQLIQDDDILQERLYNMFLTELEHDRLADAKEIYMLLKDDTKGSKELKRRMKLSLLALIDTLDIDQVFSQVGALNPKHEETIRYQHLHFILNKNKS